MLYRSNSMYYSGRSVMKVWGGLFGWMVLIAAILTSCNNGGSSTTSGTANDNGSTPTNGSAGSPPHGGGDPISEAPTLSGTVMGGAAPISGATVTLFKAGNTIGGSSSSLGSSTSDTHGKFSIPFTPPGTTSILYLVAQGGDGG